MGDGPLLNPARSLATMLGIQNKCIFKGKVQNVLEYMGASDLKLLLSAQESFGLVLLEAFSQGIPCVATNVGGIPEVLDDGVRGCLCRFASPGDAAKKSVAILAEYEALYEKVWQ